MENLLSLLPLLICPIAMGLLMWLMMRGNTSQTAGSMAMPAASVPASHSTADTGEDDRLARLRAQLSEVQAQQAAIAAQLTRLAAANRPAEPRAARAEPFEPAPALSGWQDDGGDTAGAGASAARRAPEEQHAPGA